MAAVFIDGEEVAFDGAIPDTLGALTALLENVLGRNQRVIASIRLDGAELVEAASERLVREFSRIDVATLSVVDAVAQLRQSAIKRLSDAIQDLDDLAVSVLRRPWGSVGSECVSAAETLGQLLGDLSTLAQHAVANETGDDPRRRVEAVASAIEGFLEAVTARDAASVSTWIDETLVPSVCACLSILQLEEDAGS